LAGSPAVLASAATGRLVEEDGLSAVVMSAAEQRLGTVVVGGFAELDSSARRTVERAAMVTALVLLYQLRAAEAEHRERSDLLADLLAQPDPPLGDGADSGRKDWRASPRARSGTGAATRTGADHAGLVERGRLLGLRLKEPHVLSVCLASAARRRGVAMSASAFVGPSGLAGAHLDEVVVLLPGTDASSTAAALAGRLSGADGGEAVTVGAAGPVTPADGLREAHAEARRTAEALLALGTPGRGASAGDLGFAGLVVGGPPDVSGYLERTLGPLVDYDSRRGTDLVGTLASYFAVGGSPSRAAGELHVHVNTVAQRLERIGALLGADWQSPGRALELQLALRLRALRSR
jgi:hypothetical protein